VPPDNPLHHLGITPGWIEWTRDYCYDELLEGMECPRNRRKADDSQRDQRGHLVVANGVSAWHAHEQLRFHTRLAQKVIAFCWGPRAQRQDTRNQPTPLWPAFWVSRRFAS
jgi:hypothetical protein